MDLSRLNEAERRVLGLLAEGHTAKSIAHATGSTPAAVNERLREARRKTGVGSSRELARLLKAQENRDEQIGVGSRHRVTADISPGAADPRRPKTGVYAMIGLFVIAAAGAAALMSHQPEAETPTDPLIAPFLRAPSPPPPAVADFHARVRSEQRGLWAVRTEQQIEARLMALPLVGKGGNVLRVTCGSTICEIAGTLPDSLAGFGPPKNGVLPPPPPPLTPTPFYLEKLGLRTGDFQKLGLTAVSDSLHERRPTKQFLFLLYYSRQEGAAK